MKPLKTIICILLMGVGMMVTFILGGFSYRSDGGAWVSHGQFIFLGICLFLMGIVGLYTLYLGKSE